jgi:hypothetical protein
LIADELLEDLNIPALDRQSLKFVNIDPIAERVCHASDSPKETDPVRWFYGSSTATTPRNLDKPEQEVQSLQNLLVTSLRKLVWEGRINVPWAMNRKKWLDVNFLNVR